MKSWIKNGAHLAWLIDPESETVYISQTDQEMALHHDFNIPLSADPVLKGYTLDFGRLGLPKS